MSQFYSYSQLYNAIQRGDVEEIKEAIFILGENTFKAPLVNAQSAVKYASNIGKTEIVKLLLDYKKGDSILELEQIQCQEIDNITKDLITICCLKGNIDLLKYTLQSYQHISWLTLDLLDSVCLSKSSDIFNLWFTMSQENPQLVKRLSSKLDKFVPRLLDTSFLTGNYFHSNLLPEITTSVIYIKHLQQYHPIHRAIFMQDLKEFDLLASQYTEWYNIKFHPSEQLESAFDVLCLAALMGNSKILQHVYESAEEAGAEQSNSCENACDKAVEQNRTSILEVMFQRKWMDTKYSSRWRKRLEDALKSENVEVACWILENVTISPSNSSDVTDLTTSYKFVDRQTTDTQSKNSSFGLALQCNNVKLMNLMLECIQFIAQDNDWEVNSILWDGYHQSLEYGFPEMLKLFIHEIGTDIDLDKLSHYANQSFVSVEILIQYSLNSVKTAFFELATPKTLNPNIYYSPPARSYGIRSWNRPWNILIPFLLHNHYKDLSTNKVLNVLNNCDFELLVSVKKLETYDFLDLTRQDLNFLFHPMIPDQISFYDLRKIFDLLAGCGRLRWTGFLQSCIHRTREDRTLMRRILMKRGVKIIDNGLRDHPLSCNRCKSLDEKLRTTDIVETDLISQTPSPDEISLKEQARISIRAAIQKSKLPLMGTTDKVLSLREYIPRSLVEYLLYRNDEVRDEWKDIILEDVNQRGHYYPDDDDDSVDSFLFEFHDYSYHDNLDLDDMNFAIDEFDDLDDEDNNNVIINGHPDYEFDEDEVAALNLM